MPEIRVALVGVGNCSSAFVQGLQYYSKFEEEKDFVGLRNPYLGGLSPRDIKVVAAFDVDKRKVGKDLAEAIFAKPNNTPQVTEVPLTGVIVDKGSLMDGVGKRAKNLVLISDASEIDVAEVLRKNEVEIVVSLLPSGAFEASQWYAEQSLAAGCGFINATPNAIACNSAWSKRFEEVGLPLVGDDLIDQVGSTALHKTLLELLSKSGVKIIETYQLDVGGGVESLETLDRSRDAKRAIKTQSVASALPYKAEIVAGSTDYVDFLENKRDSYFWIQGVYFYNSPMQIDLKFSTVDAPNAGSMLFDVIRATKMALDRNQRGAIIPICAYAFKRPPKILAIENAETVFNGFVSENS